MTKSPEKEKQSFQRIRWRKVEEREDIVRMVEMSEELFMRTSIPIQVQVDAWYSWCNRCQGRHLEARLFFGHGLYKFRLFSAV
jgi:hypothetical protein